MEATLNADIVAGHTGTLTKNAEVRHKFMDREGHTAPVLVLDMLLDSERPMPVHIEQVFPPGHVNQCEAAARRYRKGTRITVESSVLTHRLAVTATHIHTHGKQQEGTSS
jgi:hypothetical protein